MASSRQMRRTALSSLKAPPTIRDQSFKNNDLDLNNTPPGIDDWQEPAPRQPVPSFEDYKGLERHGVLEHMAPLGSFPGSKMKARMRQYEPTRRIMHSKNGETRPPRDEVVTPEPPPPPPPDAPVLLLPRHDGPAPVLSSTRDFNDSSIYDPRLFTGETPTLVSPTVPQSIAVQPTPSPRTQAASTQTVVRNAIQRSNALGNPTLGVALQKLYEEARYDQEYLGLLNAVLSQTTSTEQSVHFQKFLKSARKQAKRNEREQSTRQTGSSLPTSQEKNLRSGATPRSVSSDVKIFNDQSVLLNAADTPSKSAKPPTSNMPMNGVPPDKRPSPKRMKRSSSTSTDSSLSSLNSDIEKLAPDGIDPDLLKPGHPAQLPPGLSLGGASMLSSNASPEQTNADEALALRRRLARKWDNYPVGQSSVRSAISPPRKPTPPPTALQQRAQQSRRNGPERKTQGGYDSSSDSPLSSQDEMLPPPPYGVRGITPQLGRPPKATKKAVRIKQS